MSGIPFSQLMRRLITILWLLSALIGAVVPIAAAADDHVAAGPSSNSPKDAIKICQDLEATYGDQAQASDGTPAKRPANFISEKWLATKDLSGRNFSGKIFFDVDLAGARLSGADLTGAVICASDLSDADLSGARLDGALIGGETKLNDADFTGASARNIVISNAAGSIRISGADMRGANTFCREFPACLDFGVSFASVDGADLRNAAVGSLCCVLPNLNTAKLDGLITPFMDKPSDLKQLAEATGLQGQVSFADDPRLLAAFVTFSGQELHQLPSLVEKMSKDARPSFDCGRAKSMAERFICVSPELAALDNTLNWLWARVEHRGAERAAQTVWQTGRDTCVEAPGKPRALVECIERAYVTRIQVLAGKATSFAVESGRYTSDSPLHILSDVDATLARKYLKARGYSADEIAIDHPKGGEGRIAGYSTGANGHSCSLAVAEAAMQRTGAALHIVDGDERMEFIVTPDVLIVGNPHFQCGARAGWSSVYYRQPDDLIGQIKKPLDMRDPG